MIPSVSNQQRAYNGFLKIDTMDVTFPGTDRVLKREVMQRGQAACVLFYDHKTDMILVVEEFRIGNHAAGFTGEQSRSRGPVAGMIEPGQSPLQTAIRESAEEANVIVHEDTLVFGPLSTMVSPGGTSEAIHHFVALADLSKVIDGAVYGLPEEGEHTTVRVIPRVSLGLNALLDADVPTNGLLTTCMFLLQSLRINGDINLTEPY